MRQCLTFGTTKVCKDDNVLTKVPDDIPHEEQFCLPAIMREEFSAVSEICHASSMKPRKIVRQVGPYDFIIANPNLEDMPVECEGDDHITKIPRKLISTFRLKDGCVLDTDSECRLWRQE